MGNAKKRRKARAANKAKRLMQKFRPITTSNEFKKHANFLAEISKQLLNSLGVPKELLTMPKPPSQYCGIRYTDVVGWEEVVAANNDNAITIFKTGQVVGLDPTALRGNYNPDLIKSKDYKWLVRRFGLIQSVAGTALTTYQRPGILL